MFEKPVYIPHTEHMRKDVIVMLGGVFVALLPFLGFPNSWDKVLMVVTGIILFAAGIAVRRGNRPPMQLPPRVQPDITVMRGPLHHEG